MKKFLPIILIIFSLPVFSQQKMGVKGYNLSTFSGAQKIITPELETLTATGFNNHPEYGVKPYNAECADCIELIDRRTEYTRYYVGTGTNNGKIYSQSGFEPLHRKDAQGNWLSIDNRLKTTNLPHLFKSDYELPVAIDAGVGFTSVTRAGQEFKFNNNLELIFIDALGIETSFGKANWENYTAGDDGIKVIDAWPHVDMELVVVKSGVKSSFIFKQRPTQTGGKFIVRDYFEMPQGHHYAGINAGEEYIGNFTIQTTTGEEALIIQPAVAFDALETPVVTDLSYRLSTQGYLDIEIPNTWLNTPERAYPVTIDPVVTGTNTLPLASMPGSTYSVGWTTGCLNTLSVPVPPNVTFTNVYWTFNYLAQPGYPMSAGAIDLRYGVCRSPASNAFYWTCNSAASGTCTGAAIPVGSDFTSCVPTPQCASYNMQFSMRLYRNQVPGAACSFICIVPVSNWTMTVEGRTVEVTVGGTSIICPGANATISAAGQYGVPPYAISWSPGGMTGSPITVSPASSTVYTVTVTDACGQVATTTKTVNVTVVNNPGFTISPANPCVGTPVTITGLGANPPANYDWLIPGSTTPAVNNQQVVNTTYNTPGSYNVTLNYAVSGCINPMVQQVNVGTPVTPTAVISVSPAMPVCAGTPLTFSAVITNGGTVPVYTWRLNGAPVSNSITYTTSLYGNGDIVTLDLTSNAGCATPATVTSNAITLQVTNVVTPSVFVGAAPAGQICAGTNVTFTAIPTNGGTLPAYQWKVNGINVGTNSSTYSSTALANGDQVSVELTPNLPCLSQPTATSNVVTMVVVQPVTPLVSITQNPAGVICLGTNVTFTATPTNGGGAPSYQWLLNGSPVGSNAVTYSTTTLASGDIVSVTLTSNATCAAPSTATSNQLSATVNPVITPTVNINVSPTLPVCAGTNLTFTATPTNAGVGPSYQWSLNGINVGTNSATYSNATLVTGDQVSVVLTSTYACSNPSTATSNTINISFSPLLVPTVSIAASPVSPICAGTNVTFTATPINGGSTPGFQWTLNGVNTGSNSATFSTTTLASGDVVGVTLTSSETCASPTTATSNTISTTVNPLLTPSVIIAASPAGQVCQGTPITFTATPANGGTAPTYQWQVNGVNVGTNSPTYTITTPVNGNVVSAILTSNEPCVTNATATSNNITLNVVSVLVPTASITANQTMPVCDNAAVTFTATISGGGINPAYQWYVNGVAAAGETQATYNYIAVNGDAITVQLTSSDVCANPTTVTSAPYNVQTLPFLTPSVSVVSNTNGTICFGQNVTFTATPTNGGSAPSYQWQVNGLPVGTNSPTFSTNSINPGDVVEVVMTSNSACLNQPTATSNQITLVINPPITVAITPLRDTICAYEVSVLTALATGGDGGPYTYIWSMGDTATNVFVSPAITTTYTVNAYDQCGTAPGTASAVVQVSLTPVANFTYAPDSAITTLDDVFFDNNSFNASWWTWSFGDGTVIDTVNIPSHNYPTAGVYTVQLLAVSADGCRDSINVKLNILEQVLFYVPNTFTPDQDGINELFKIYTFNINEPYSLVIYARNGEEVYNSTTDSNGTNIYWTGQKHNQGIMLPDGVYVYQLKIDSPYLNKNDRTTYGTVLLIR